MSFFLSQALLVVLGRVVLQYTRYFANYKYNNVFMNIVTTFSYFAYFFPDAKFLALVPGTKLKDTFL